MAQLLSPAPANAPGGRISQLLPTVKCSNCNQPVPLAELGDHSCAPAAPSLPKPAVSPSAAASLLPQRLKNLVSSSPPSPPPRVAIPSIPQSPPGPKSAPPTNPPQQPRRGSAATERPRINTGPSRSSPLARPDPDNSFSPIVRQKDPFAANVSSPLGARPPGGNDPRTRVVSNAGSMASSSGSPTRPVASSSKVQLPPRQPPPMQEQPRQQPRDNGPPPRQISPQQEQSRVPDRNNMMPPRQVSPQQEQNNPPNRSNISPAPRQASPPRDRSIIPPLNIASSSNISPPQPPRQVYTPAPEHDIDTKSGGEAGMAGVGRRGFAAAARAAMFAAPHHGDRPYDPHGRHHNGHRYLDIDTATRPSGTPPLSAGSGSSSQSSVGPMSPLPQSPEDTLPKVAHTPSPPPQGRPIPGPIELPPTKAQLMENTPPASPMSIRMPFFEKFKNKLPGINTTPTPPATTDIIPSTSANTNLDNINTPSTKSPSPDDQLDRSSASSYSPSAFAPSRSGSMASSHRRTRIYSKDGRIPVSPDSDSEYGGLAYADSTDDEDGDELRKANTTPIPPLPNLGGLNIVKTSHVRFPSLSDRSETHVGSGLNARRKKRSGSNFSSSSISSVSDVEDRSHALAEARKGRRSGDTSDNGVSNVFRQSSRTGGAPPRQVAIRARSSSESSSGSGTQTTRSKAFSRITIGTGPGMGGLDRAMETLLEDIGEVEGKVLGSEGTQVERPFTGAGISDRGSVRGSGIGGKAHRSNTVQGPYSPEGRSIKLPVRSKTGPTGGEREKAAEEIGVRDEQGAKIGQESDKKIKKLKKEKVCLKCAVKIQDGRWVQVDGGGVLCERCWKNMYLPKCRRCNLPIERQAVSSSDGQLKGKYHRECFNCHTCHKPFPDKTFYVFDGKPLCAYHYHEQNESLCAAARCGQPIEGPCALSHTGDRYHPEHLTCEYAGVPPCEERLDEYWELDGRMLCERHANAGESDADTESADAEGSAEDWVRNSKARKRVTRFIDLAGGGGLGSNGLM